MQLIHTHATAQGTVIPSVRGLPQRSYRSQALRCRHLVQLQQRWHKQPSPLRRSAVDKRPSVAASAASAAQQPEEAPAEAKGIVDKFKALLSPFSEPTTNKKLLALCSAQALSSVATLIHDTYLPLYLSEELKLSNTKVTFAAAEAPYLTSRYWRRPTV